MKVRVLFAGVLATLLSTAAMAQVDGFSIGPAGAQWDKEGKVQNATQTDCADVSASFPLSGPITEVPTSYLLNTGKLIKGIAPNPAVGATQLKYFLPTAGNVTVKVFNTIGSEVATLQNGPQAAGEQSLTWNADVAPGIYHISIASNGRSDSRKIVVK